MLKRIFLATSALLTAPSAVALAQVATVPSTGVPTTILGFYNLVCIATNWFFSFVILIAVFFLLYGALKFFSAGGNEDSVATARRYLAYALVGIAVAILARSFVFVVGNFLGAPTSGLFGC